MALIWTAEGAIADLGGLFVDGWGRCGLECTL